MKPVLPNGWPRPSGYSAGVVAEGRVLFVSGQIGWDASGRIVSADFAEQVAQALRNVVAVVLAAGATPADVARLTWYVTDKREYLASLKAIGAAYRDVFGAHYPAMSVVEVSGLLEHGAKVEIEATAVIPHDRA
ncbi:MAG: RidA family protein [Candidatus Eremiobacteraeota bacterium]|nr:RidA family protein [Candidatus Eremiobacteraeota bacterium]